MSEINSTEKDPKFFIIYFSYCWHDQNQVQKVAQDVSEMDFKILFDEDDEKLNLNIYNSIHKCDLILVCLSKNYLKCFSCQQEAKYFFEKKIPTLTISIEEDFVADKWLSKLIAGKQYKQMIQPIQYPHSKSLLHKKLDQIYSKMKYHDILEQRFNKRLPNPEEIVKRKSSHENKFNSLIEKEQKRVSEEKETIQKLFACDDLISGLQSEVPIIYRWYIKYPNVTLSNFPAFSPTGDLNDAVFPYPPDSLKNLECISKKQPHTNGRGSISSPSHLNTQRTVNLCRLSAEYDRILAEKKTDKPDYAHEYFAKLIERNYSFNTVLSNNKLWRSLVGFAGPERTEEDMERRRKLDSDLSMRKKRRLELCKFFNDRYKNCPSDAFCKFAQLMLKNKQEFETICEKNGVVIEIFFKIIQHIDQATIGIFIGDHNITYSLPFILH
ncbi:hypothetical protein BpHYR1_000089 [Brachionus plicatilis]|uniref:C3H1-type domain-containing protein n=1 Tax=Brachionus plicatilis TaxID=10195 RepID=A0A3M7PNH3_BRAPC|nr:hypothetical protein BpHYR1_000089 [Brachionus plicatilis]